MTTQRVAIPVLLCKRRLRDVSNSPELHSYVSYRLGMVSGNGSSALSASPQPQGAPGRMFWGSLHVEEAPEVFWEPGPEGHSPNVSDFDEPRAAQPGAPCGIFQPSPGTVASVFLG